MPSKLPKNIDELIDENFMDKNKFSMTIENIVKDSNKTINYIDAIVDFCESKNIEIESVTKLIAPSLKEKIKVEATRLNYIKKINRGVLPI
jgi:organic radical activating enzyme